MKRVFVGMSALLLCGLVQAGTVQVSFIHPERFADAGRGVDAEATRKTLDQHLQGLGAEMLPAPQVLKVDILDIDLAGETRPMFNLANDVRVIKGRADWPRIHLRYTLLEGDDVLASGDETLSDMDYLMRHWVGDSDRALPYERRMLSDWFRQRFVAGAIH